MASLKTSRIHAVFLLLTWAFIAAAFKQDPRNEFYNHAVVHPLVYKERLIRKDASSLEVLTDEEVVNLKFEAFGKNFAVQLKENKNLFSPNFKEIYDEDGKEVVYERVNENEKRCYYQGHLPNVENSLAAISTCDGISGIISNGKETYYIEPNRMSESTEHLVFKASDRKHQSFKCGVKDDLFSVHERFSKVLDIQNLEDPYKSNEDSRYIEVAVINANDVFLKYNKSKETVLRRTNQIINVANSILSQLNTFLTLQSIRVWMARDRINISTNSTKTLKNFLKYREELLLTYDPNDNAIFITDTDYDEGVLGNSYRGAICNKDGSGENIRDSSDVVGIVGAIVAHEIGHNLGSPHDEDECECVDDYCIMYPYFLSDAQTHWSSCSKEAIQKIHSSGKDSCLRNKPTKVYGPSCGNGYLEEDEECDCGTKQFCDDACCDADTCRKLRSYQCF